ncbi:hypothetical protein [Kitasatospora terrestris]|uniref:Secreted protein n=1 Tax=Kitasatospora terrestris TaxID=258051 RepID=A0ABP9DPB9_9ACTN
MSRTRTGAGALAAIGTAVLLSGANAGAAQAEQVLPADLPLPATQLQNTDAAQAVGGTTSGLGYAIAPVKELRLDPWAGSSADFLNNGVAVAPDNGMPPVATSAVTGPLSNGGGAKDLPVAGALLGALPL